MAESIERRIRTLAGDRCEYCRVPQSGSRFRHVLDHIIAQQHRGATRFDNLALCCIECNYHKGPNIAGIDPHTNRLTRLFHPREDDWDEHFQWSGAVLSGRTDVGRTTIEVLAINAPLRAAARQTLIDEGVRL